MGPFSIPFSASLKSIWLKRFHKRGPFRLRFWGWHFGSSALNLLNLSFAFEQQQQQHFPLLRFGRASNCYAIQVSSTMYWILNPALLFNSEAVGENDQHFRNRKSPLSLYFECFMINFIQCEQNYVSILSDSFSLWQILSKDKSKHFQSLFLISKLFKNIKVKKYSSLRIRNFVSKSNTGMIPPA